MLHLVHVIGSERARIRAVNRYDNSGRPVIALNYLQGPVLRKFGSNLIARVFLLLWVCPWTYFPTNGVFFWTHGKLYFVSAPNLWHRICVILRKHCFRHLSQHQIISSSFCRWSLMSALPRQPCASTWLSLSPLYQAKNMNDDAKSTIVSFTFLAQICTCLLDPEWAWPIEFWLKSILQPLFAWGVVRRKSSDAHLLEL